MSYITITTSTGHKLMVQPKRQRLLMFDLQDAAVAESRLDERRLNYARYRSRREMPAADFAVTVTFAQSVKKDLSHLSKDEFCAIDNGVIALSRNPCPADSQVERYKWFDGNLRRTIIGNFPVIYTFLKKSDSIVLLRLGVQRWPHTPRSNRKLQDQSRQRS
ncbi:MAG TPA: hypothetical protein VMD55_05850 [Terracidiphilus sp.]|nr:hypothetical protein [Terracidiphilus sp.]